MKLVPTFKGLFKTIKLGIASTGIGVLVIALGAVFTAMMSTEKGGKALKAIMNGIGEVVNFLIKLGCKIKWIAKRSLKILGVSELNQISYTVMFDRIEAGTYLIAGALTEGNLKIIGIDPKIIGTEINILKKIGAKITKGKNEINIKGGKKIKNINIKTAPYPGFPTDLQAQIMVLLCKANKKSIIKEDIFENRFMHVAELRRLGAKIIIKGNKAIVDGPTQFNGAELMSSDLRASVALVIASIIAKGESTINRIYHLDRGYEEIEKKFKKIGVKIKRIN